jgi:hypothetical protein
MDSPTISFVTGGKKLSFPGYIGHSRNRVYVNLGNSYITHTDPGYDTAEACGCAFSRSLAFNPPLRRFLCHAAERAELDSAMG